MKKLLTFLFLLPILVFGQTTPTMRQVTGAGTAITKLPSASTTSVNTTNDTLLIFQDGQWKKVKASLLSGSATLTVNATPIASGTSGAIPFNNAGVYGEDATQLFWDNTNNRLGVGTNAPSYKLHLGLSPATNNADGLRLETSGTVQGALYATGTAFSYQGVSASEIWLQSGGNSNGIVIGPDNTGYVRFVSNGSERMRISTDGLVNIGYAGAGAVSTRFSVKGSGATSATYSMKVQNSASTDLFNVRDDGYIGAGTSTGHLTIGLNSGFNTAITRNTFIGVGVGAGVITNGGNTGVGYNAFLNLTSAQSSCAFGDLALTSMTTGGVGVGANNAFGSSALAGNTTGYYNNAFGESAMLSNQTGKYNSAFGHRSLYYVTGSYNTAVGAQAFLNSTGDENTGVGFSAGQNTTSGTNNTFVGSEAGKSNISGSRNVFIGNYAGYYETGSDKLFIDSKTRSNEADGRKKALITGGFGADSSSQWVKVNGEIRFTKGINASAGDAVTLQGQAGQFVKDNSGTTFTLTNALIKTTSIILLTFASDPGVSGNYAPYVTAGTGSATITFTNGAPANNTTVNFLIINNN